MKKDLTIIMLILLLGSLKSYAQVDDLFDEKQYRNGYVSFAKIKKEKSATAKTRKETIIREFTGNNSDLSFVKTVRNIPSKNNLKIQQEKYQLYKNGIKLRGGEYVINFVNDSISFVHGFFAIIANEAFTEQYNAEAWAA
jgi:hypothetical protein